MRKLFLLIGLVLLNAGPGFADKVSVTVNEISPAGVGKALGTVELSDRAGGGVDIAPNLTGLAPGAHGFHVHENPSCEPGEKEGKMAAGIGAGGHFDPNKTGKHDGPQGMGHLGDLAALTVTKDGTAKAAMSVPRLTVAQLKGHSIMIHAGGDNYSDQPQPLGGGGARIACGVIAQ